MSFEFIFGPKTSRGKKGKSLILGISCDFVTVNRWIALVSCDGVMLALFLHLI